MKVAGRRESLTALLASKEINLLALANSLTLLFKPASGLVETQGADIAIPAFTGLVPENQLPLCVAFLVMIGANLITLATGTT